MNNERTGKSIDRTVKVSGVDVIVPVIVRGDTRKPNMTPRITSTLTGGDLTEDVLERGTMNTYGSAEFIGKKDDSITVSKLVRDGYADLGIVDAFMEDNVAEEIFRSEDLTGYSLLDKESRMPKDPITLITRQKGSTHGMNQLINAKRHINEEGIGSCVLIDPCEVTMELVRKDCPNRTEDESLCSIGVLLQKGIPFCPLEPTRQLTLRSDSVLTVEGGQSASE